jgi:uncharacterized membrane protein YbhN (UPF0104 family)
VLGIALAAVTAAGDLPDVDWRFRPGAIAVAIGAMAAANLATAEIWRRILRALGPELTAPRARAIWFTSNLGRYVPTSLLLPVLRTAMAEREGAPKRITLASVVYEMALFVTAGLFLGAYFVIDLPDLQDSPGRFLVLILPLLALTCLQPRIFHNLADRVLARLGRPELPLSLSGVRVLEFVGLYALTYVLFGLSLYAIAQCVYPVGLDDMVTVAGAFAVGTSISVIAFVLPGGLVAREAAIALALSPAMPAAPAVAAAVLVRILQLGVEVVLAVLTPLLARRSEARRGLSPT